MRVRLTQMNGADVGLFQFDWYMQWVGFFMNAQGHIYARYGVRKKGANQDESLMSLAGLRTVMTKVLEVHKTEKDRKPDPWTPRTAESFSKVPEPFKTGKSCMHCHYVWVYAKNESPVSKLGGPDYPLPEDVGILLNLDLGNAVRAVAAGSAAETAGIQAGDVILSMNGTPTYSSGDMSFALAKTRKGLVEVEVERKGRKTSVQLTR